MLIDINDAEKNFLRYTKEFDYENNKISRKVSHSLRVKNISREIAENIFKEQEDVDLAELIGLLHDIGRFEQAKQTNSFVDGIVDHADIGTEVLTKDNYIRKFIPDNKFDNIIFKSIRNHNKFKIEDGLNDREMKYAKIIRDADKLDILYLYATIEDINYLIEGIDLNDKEITPEVFDAFFECKQLNRKNLNHFLDFYINTIAFIFDLNEKYTFKYLNYKNYMNEIINNIENLVPERINEFEKIRDFVSFYIESKANS